MNSVNERDFGKLHRICVLREEIRRIADRMARYRFCAFRFAEPEYYIEILYGDARAAARLGEDYAGAQILFDAVVAGTVTPCTLIDVITDAKNSHICSLQKEKNML
jgi:hypothetical protein